MKLLCYVYYQTSFNSLIRNQIFSICYWRAFGQIEFEEMKWAELTMIMWLTKNLVEILIRDYLIDFIHSSSKKSFIICWPITKKKLKNFWYVIGQHIIGMNQIYLVSNCMLDFFHKISIQGGGTRYILKFYKSNNHPFVLH